MDTYTKLSPEERRRLLLRIGEQYHMHYQEPAVFSRWGRTSDTAVYEYQGSEFVFVPGAEVTLGWNEFAQGMDEAARSEIQEMMDEYGIEDSIEEFLRSCTSAVRQVTVGPMLVERRQQEIGWEAVELDDPRIAQNREYQEEVRKLQPGKSIEFVGHARFVRGEHDIFAAVYHDMTYTQLKKQLAADGFSLPTSDEWEYLCGGGCRTLFPWGDSFPDDIHVRYFESEAQKNTPYTLEQPNFFGLVIGFNPYRREVVDEDQKTFKGGDGGCNTCGGLGRIMAYLPCAPCFTTMYEEDEPDEELDGDFDFIRRIIRIDRAITD